MKKRMVAAFLAVFTALSFSVPVSASSDDVSAVEDPDIDQILNEEFVPILTPVLINKYLDLSSMVGYDYSGFSTDVKSIQNAIAEVTDNSRELVYEGVGITPKQEYMFARDYTSLGDFFRTALHIAALSDGGRYYFRVDAADVQALSDFMKDLCGVWFEGCYLSSVGGYCYRVLYDKSKINDAVLSRDHFFYLGLKVFLSVDPSGYFFSIADALGLTGWNNLIDFWDGGAAVEQTKFLTSRNGCLIVGVQGDSAATTEQNYYDNTTNTNINVEDDHSFNVEIKDSGNSTTNVPIDINANEFWNVKANEYQAIESLYYNAGDKTYIINNTYEYTFYYDYTYFVSIGASAVFETAFKIYFELPDGRNSKDLTEDEIFGLSTDAGFVNFDVANEDPDLLGLFPMEGTLDNVAVGDYSARFLSGASTSYLEAENFGGALFVPTGSESELFFDPGDTGDWITLTGDSYDPYYSFNLRNIKFSHPFIGKKFTYQFRMYTTGQASSGTNLVTFPCFGNSAYSDLLPNISFQFYYEQYGRGTGSWNKTTSSYGNSTPTNFIPTSLVFDSASTAKFAFDGSSSSEIYSDPFVVSGVWNDVCIEVDYPDNFSIYRQNNASSITFGIDYPYNMTIWVNGVRVLNSSIPFRVYPRYTDKQAKVTSVEYGYGSPFFNFDLFLASSAAFGGYQIDNVRILEGLLHDPSMENIPVPGQPFDSNKVLVLPEDTADLKVPTIAVYSDIPIIDTRIGGVRQAIPKRGYVYCYVDKNRITSIQIYDGSGWLDVGGMIWTGTRWVDPSAYDVIRYSELFDVGTEESIQQGIDNTNSTLSSIHDTLKSLRDGVFGKLDAILAAMGAGTNEDPNITDPDANGNSIFTPLKLIDAILSAVVEIASAVLVEFIGLVADLIKMFIQALMDFVGGMVGVISSGVGHLSVFGDSVADAGTFVSDCWSAVPDDIQAVLTSSAFVIVIVGLISILL